MRMIVAGQMTDRGEKMERIVHTLEGTGETGIV